MAFWNKKKKVENVTPPQVIISVPIYITIENISNEEQPFVLFGSSINLPKPNLGNNEHIKVTSPQTSNEFEYGAILYDLLSEHITISMLRFQSSNEANLKKDIMISEQFPHGEIFQKTYKPLRLSLMKDAYQFQSGILDVKHVVNLHKRSTITGALAPNSSITISLYPTQIISLENTAAYHLELLSGKNVAPVVFSIPSNPIKKQFLKFWNWILTPFKKSQKSQSND